MNKTKNDSKNRQHLKQSNPKTHVCGRRIDPQEIRSPLQFHKQKQGLKRSIIWRPGLSKALGGEFGALGR